MSEWICPTAKPPRPPCSTDCCRPPSVRYCEGNVRSKPRPTTLRVPDLTISVNFVRSADVFGIGGFGPPQPILIVFRMCSKVSAGQASGGGWSSGLKTEAWVAKTVLVALAGCRADYWKISSNLK